MPCNFRITYPDFHPVQGLHHLISVPNRAAHPCRPVRHPAPVVSAKLDAMQTVSTQRYRLRQRVFLFLVQMLCDYRAEDWEGDRRLWHMNTFVAGKHQARNWRFVLKERD